MNSPKVVVEGLCKVFGANPKAAVDLLARGATKDEIFAKTGQIVGVHNVSFDVQEGEIFVLMGLSGSGKSTLIRLINRLVAVSSPPAMPSPQRGIGRGSSGSPRGTWRSL